MAYQEFYCDANAGNNMNGGSPNTGGIYPYTKTNGGWSSVTGVFTPTSGNPSTDGVQVGDFAAVFTDGSTTPGFVGRVTTVGTTSITISITNKIGTIPTTAASGITCKVGGAWKGPTGTAVTWPVGNVNTPLTDSSTHIVRVNLKNGTTYSPTTALTLGQNVIFQGYTTTPGDKGKAIIDWGGNAVISWTQSGLGAVLADVIIQNNNASGTNAGISSTSATSFVRVVVQDVGGAGFTNSGVGTYYEECEAYNTNSGSVASTGGFTTSVYAVYNRCISHDNVSTGTHGFCTTSAAAVLLMIDCISDTNNAGLKITSSAGPIIVLNSDFYNNGADGIDFSASNSSYGIIQNSNFVLNAAAGIKGHSAGTKYIIVTNCGYGTGTKANSSGMTSGTDVVETGAISYPADMTPWVDPANGDFRVILADAIGKGIGSFTQTAASYAGALGFPTVGACQALSGILAKQVIVGNSGLG